MKRQCTGLFAMLVLSVSSGAANASAIVLDFEGVGDLVDVADFYDAAYGITFGDGATVFTDTDAGGSGLFANEPSPDTIVYFDPLGSAVMNVAGGFDTAFSFYYTSISDGLVSIYDGLDGTGNQLATIVLGPTAAGPGDPTGGDNFGTWLFTGTAFAGTAMSVDFSGATNTVGFDNITLGASIPEPATWLMMIMGFGLVGIASRRRTGALAL
ncbi:PEPxxWA-CTERM sorting domain-containing protein [Pseudokordiimonas caeni]|uniref:PEPxxWA-CTERM sorting domain-containing protein n=1 Tax=Pseudokordiimonas caeni TaxID=2997908 RepID=UPI00281224D3|nr:PEPxxWA-CTERM sorting domain-containing protein [Pseudokordiimonas caeni]